MTLCYNTTQRHSLSCKRVAIPRFPQSTPTSQPEYKMSQSQSTQHKQPSVALDNANDNLIILLCGFRNVRKSSFLGNAVQKLSIWMTKVPNSNRARKLGSVTIKYDKRLPEASEPVIPPIQPLIASHSAYPLALMQVD